jgi:branched-chain amino acid transport system substrate-binding protein
MRGLRMKWLMGSLLVLAIPILCSSPVWAKEQEIKIGTLIPLTGSLSALGINAKYGCDMAGAEINQAGGIKSLGGAKIKMVHGDSEGKADTGMSVAERLVKQAGVVACLSGPQSGVTFATSQITEKYKIPHIITGSIADEITQRGFKYVFRICPTATTWSLAQLDLINYLRKKGQKIENIAFFYEDTLWGQSQVKAWKGNKGDLKIVADLPYPHGTSDLTVTITKLKAAKPDVVLICSYVSDAILMTKTMFELDFNCQALLTSGAGPEDPLFYKNVGELSENITVVTMFSDQIKNPLAKEKARKYEGIFNQPMADHSAAAYSGIYVIADALERAASADPEKIRGALAKTNICSGPATIVPIKCMKFDETGQSPMIPIQVQWRKGKLIPVWPDEMATGKVIWPMPTWKERGLKK